MSEAPAQWAAWRTHEVSALRDLYPLGGAAAVRAAMPHRTLGSIYTTAQRLGIRCHKPSTQGKRFERVHHNSERIDQMIRDAYAQARRRGDLKRLLAPIGRPAWWVHKRAAVLGCTHNNRARVGQWQADEIALLERWGSCTLVSIRRKLAAAGHQRTETAIAIKLKRLRIDRDDPDTWTARGLAELLGVTGTTVIDWIERRGLPATCTQCGSQRRYTVTRRALRGWIRLHPRYVDLRRVDQPWFMELAFGPA